MKNKPLCEFLPCPECLGELDAQRAKVGEQSFASGWCPHRQIFVAWSLGDLVLRPCATVDEAQRYAQAAHAMIEQSIAVFAQHIAEQRRRSGRLN